MKRLQKLKEKAEQKEKKKAALKAEKMMRKRQEKLNQLKSQPATEQMLRDVDFEIIESLSLTNRVCDFNLL
jgi:phage shock protein A